jgi:uncharacterized protein CbrC (UPF0167 family)
MSKYEYRYFAEPHVFSTYTDGAKACAICGEHRYGYDEPFYGDDEIDFICEPCMLAGRLIERGLKTNLGDASILRVQLRSKKKKASPDEIAKLAEERTAVIETQTPAIVMWEALSWPSHCGDYCRFIGEVGQPDIVAIAPKSRAREWFDNHVIDRELYDGKLWDIVPDKSANGRPLNTSNVFYLYQCLECNEYVIAWDSE